MQTNLRLLPVLTLALVTALTACKKEAAVLSAADNAVEVKTHTDDQSTVSTELDAVANDANVAVESDTYFAGRFQSPQNTAGVCGATVVADTVSNPRTITLNYNGINCAGTALRTGTVVLSIPAGTRWHNAGAALTISVQNLKIKRLSDNKTVTLNGVQTITNVSGGLLLNLSTLQSITHTITSGNMSITFNDGSQRSWQVARKHLFTYNNGTVLTITGIGTSGSVTNATEWGTNRFGHAFTTSITEPLVFRQDCAGRLTSGRIMHQGFAIATATFGLNASGVATTCPGTGNYYYKLTWTGPGGNDFSAIFPY